MPYGGNKVQDQPLYYQLIECRDLSSRLREGKRKIFLCLHKNVAELICLSEALLMSITTYGFYVFMEKKVVKKP